MQENLELNHSSKEGISVAIGDKHYSVTTLVGSQNSELFLAKAFKIGLIFERKTKEPGILGAYSSLPTESSPAISAKYGTF